MIFDIPPIQFWTPNNFPSQIKSELLRRENNRGFNYIVDTKGTWNDSTGEWTQYKGPMSPWLRFTSNGNGQEIDAKGNFLMPPQFAPGFILVGGKDFYQTYGFDKTSTEKASGVIGYQPDGIMTPHIIENDINDNYPIHVPAPEIEKITVTIQKELYRKAIIDWVCFSKKQLEYMTPYFMVPGISCVLEWGWNHYNPDCLLDVSDEAYLKKLMNNPYPLYTNHILKSNGNYDVMMGIITNFTWSVEGNKFKCQTEILSKDRIYAGLSVDATVEEISISSDGGDESSKSPPKLPFGNLSEFILKSVNLLKSTTSKSSNLLTVISLLDTPSGVSSANYPQLSDEENKIFNFILYLKRTRKNWKEYIYGIFHGRDVLDVNINSYQHRNVNDDFDGNGETDNLWLNMGLVIDILNYHTSKLSNKQTGEIFKIDIDDVKITGHANMISSDGSVLLIPNKQAPKYFVGLGLVNSTGISNVDVDIMEYTPIISSFTTNSSPADARLHRICLQPKNSIYRDDLDELINANRKQNNVVGNFEFPSVSDKLQSGYLKNLYINTSFLEKIMLDTDVKTYTDVIEKLLSGISAACGNFWDLRLVAGAGNPDLTSQSCMKIVDFKYISPTSTAPYTFKYMSNESILTGIDFKPTLSNAQAIRAIYSPTSLNKNSNRKLNNGNSELLDYKFRDRLFLSEIIKESDTSQNQKTSLDILSILKDLQVVKPSKEMFQMTSTTNNYKTLITTGRMRGNYTTSSGNIIVRRLVLPNVEILNMLLDDGDYDNNTNYTGIMPGIQASFTLQGIGGLRTFMMFLVDGLPEPYSSTNIVFRITDVTETIEAGKWATQITAGVIPLRNQIKLKLGIK